MKLHSILHPTKKADYTVVAISVDAREEKTRSCCANTAIMSAAQVRASLVNERITEVKLLIIVFAITCRYAR